MIAGECLCMFTARRTCTCARAFTCVLDRIIARRYQTHKSNWTAMRIQRVCGHVHVCTIFVYTWLYYLTHVPYAQHHPSNIITWSKTICKARTVQIKLVLIVLIRDLCIQNTNSLFWLSLHPRTAHSSSQSLSRRGKQITPIYVL